MICAILLAAGRSRRMGTQKLLLPYAGATVVAHVVDQVLASRVDEVAVVVGRDRAAIAAALRDRPVRLVENPEPDAEMLTSVRCGLRALPPECSVVLVALGDQPGITADLVDRLVLAYPDSGRTILVPVYGGQRGHPVLFSRSYCDRLLQEYDSVGLRGLLADHPADVLEVPVDCPAAVTDLDTPEDYACELDRLRRRLT